MSKSLFENSDLCLVGSNSKDKNPTINQVKEDSELRKLASSLFEEKDNSN